MNPLLLDHILDSLDDSTRSNLLRGVAAVVSRKNPREATVQDVLDEASYSRRTFYQCFDNFEDAMAQLFAVCSEKFFAHMEQIVDEPNSLMLDRLMRYVDSYLEIQHAGGRLTFAFYTESTRPESPLAPTREELLDQLTTSMHRRAEHDLEQSIDPLVMRALLLSVEAMVMHFKQRNAFDAAAIERTKAVAVGMLQRVLLPHEERLPLPPAPN